MSIRVDEEKNGSKLLILISSLRTNQPRYDKSAIINDRLHFKQRCYLRDTFTCHKHTIYDSRLIDV